MSKLRVGIIGTGFGRSVHAPIFSLHKGFEVVSIASVHRARDDRHYGSTVPSGITLYKDWTEMLRSEQLDLVSVASKPVHHFEMVSSSIQRGCHVLCEKPLGMNRRETHQLMIKAKEQGICGFVNFQWRWVPVRQRIKEIIQCGNIGVIQHIKYHGSFSGYGMLTDRMRSWEGRIEEGGGFLFAVGSHMIDSLMWWMDSNITDVSASLRTIVPYYNGEAGTEIRDADDAITVMGRFQGGASFIADLFVPGVTGNGWRLEMYGTKGTLLMKDDKTLQLSTGGGFEEISVEEVRPPAGLEPSAAPYYSGFYPMVNAMYNSIKRNNITQHLPTFNDGHEVQIVLDAVRQSSAEQSWVSI